MKISNCIILGVETSIVATIFGVYIGLATFFIVDLYRQEMMYHAKKFPPCKTHAEVLKELETQCEDYGTILVDSFSMRVENGCAIAEYTCIP